MMQILVGRHVGGGHHLLLALATAVVAMAIVCDGKLVVASKPEANGVKKPQFRPHSQIASSLRGAQVESRAAAAYMPPRLVKEDPELSFADEEEHVQFVANMETEIKKADPLHTERALSSLASQFDSFVMLENKFFVDLCMDVAPKTGRLEARTCHGRESQRLSFVDGYIVVASEQDRALALSLQPAKLYRDLKMADKDAASTWTLRSDQRFQLDGTGYCIGIAGSGNDIIEDEGTRLELHPCSWSSHLDKQTWLPRAENLLLDGGFEGSTAWHGYTGFTTDFRRGQASAEIAGDGSVFQMVDLDSLAPGRLLIASGYSKAINAAKNLGEDYSVYVETKQDLFSQFQCSADFKQTASLDWEYSSCTFAWPNDAKVAAVYGIHRNDPDGIVLFDDFKLEVAYIAKPAAMKLQAGVRAGDDPATMYDGTPCAACYRQTPEIVGLDTSDSKWVELDLGEIIPIVGVTLWHYWIDSRRYYSQKVQISLTGEFAGEEETVYDTGLGQLGPVETEEGNRIVLDTPIRGRYVRHYCGRSTSNTAAHFIEIMVHAKTADPCVECKIMQSTISSARDGKMCLEASDHSVHMGKCNGSKSQKWTYEEDSGLIQSQLYDDKCVAQAPGEHSNTDGNVILSAENLNTDLILTTCSDGHFEQMWNYYNHMFYLVAGFSKEDESQFKVLEWGNELQLGTAVGGDNQRWHLGDGHPLFPKAIHPQRDRSMCMEVRAGSLDDYAPIDIARCTGETRQQWKMDSDNELIRSELTDKCVSLVGCSPEGATIYQATCDSNNRKQMWKYKDGRLYFAGNKNQIYNGHGGTNPYTDNCIVQFNSYTDDYVMHWSGPYVVSLSSISDDISQRWLVQSKLGEASTPGSSIRIRNDSDFPAQCSLGQVGPLYWGVIYPGEEFYRIPGPFHYTIHCQFVFDGKETIDTWDAILPVANIVSSVILACATAGLTTAGTLSANAALAANTVGSGVISAVTSGEIEAILFAMAAPLVMAKLGSLSITQAIKESVMKTAVIQKTIMGAKSLMRRNLASATSAEGSSVLTKVGIAGGKKVATRTLRKMGTHMASSGIFTTETMHVSSHGVYANGKSFVLRGGPHFKSSAAFDAKETSALALLDGTLLPEEVTILEATPLRLDKAYSLASMASCDSNSDCMMGACGRLQAGSDLVCCPSGDYGTYGGFDYCIGSALPGEACMFDEMCVQGYCDGGGVLGIGAGVCVEAREEHEPCFGHNQCLSTYCGGNLNVGTEYAPLVLPACAAATGNGDPCDDDDQCESKACGRLTYSSDKYICCPSGDTVTALFQYCTYHKDHGQTCYIDEMCRSGFCNSSNGLGGWEGDCYNPKEDGEECLDDGNDRSCKNEDCSLELADSNMYICCPHGSSICGSSECCDKMGADKDACWKDSHCRDGHMCHDNLSGTKEGQCAPTGLQKWEQCWTSRDWQCADGLECGLESSDSSNYICCPHGSSVCGSSDCCDKMGEDKDACWKDSHCKDGYKCYGNLLGTQEGQCAATGLKEWDECWTTADWQCSSGRDCARDKVDNYKYRCCSGGDWHPDRAEYCRKALNNGEKCRFDDMCKSGQCYGDVCIATNLGQGKSCPYETNLQCASGHTCNRSTRYGDYKCCRDTCFCDWWDSGCTTGFWYCEGYGIDC